MQIVIPDELEEELRKKASEEFGYKKGSISKAVEEAIQKWLSSR
jgi:hypothetical protein